jgi:hypothetical protein
VRFFQQAWALSLGLPDCTPLGCAGQLAKLAISLEVLTQHAVLETTIEADLASSKLVIDLL